MSVYRRKVSSDKNFFFPTFFIVRIPHLDICDNIYISSIHWLWRLCPNISILFCVFCVLPILGFLIGYIGDIIVRIKKKKQNQQIPPAPPQSKISNPFQSEINSQNK